MNHSRVLLNTCGNGVAAFAGLGIAARVLSMIGAYFGSSIMLVHA
jgi:hypothetical protein